MYKIKYNVLTCADIQVITVFWFCTPQKIPNPKWNDGKACSVPTSTNDIKVTCILCREHVFHLVTNALSRGYRQTILSGTRISIKHSTGCWLNCNEINFHFVNGLFKKNYLHVYRYYLLILFLFHFFFYKKTDSYSTVVKASLLNMESWMWNTQNVFLMNKIFKCTVQLYVFFFKPRFEIVLFFNRLSFWLKQKPWTKSKKHLLCLKAISWNEE